MSCSDNNEGCGKPTSVPRKTKKVTCARQCGIVGNQLKLKMLFTDHCGNPVDIDGATVTFEDPNGVAVDLGLQVARIDLGYYYVEHNFNISGQWKDFWTVGILGENITFESGFEIISGGNVVQPKCGLDFNSLILIKLKNLKDVDGNLLLKDYNLFFTTEYNPFYASVEMLKMEMGSWVNNVSDDTIALSIHWSSLEADNITGKRPNSERYFFARSRFVMYDAAMRLFSMPVGSFGNDGKQKQLGDLLIENKESLDFDLKDLLKELRAERDEWWRVVNAGGCIVNGQGLGPSFAEKSRKSKGYSTSREWHDPWVEGYVQPSQNSKYRVFGEKKYKHGFTPFTDLEYTQVKRSRRR